MPRYEVTFLDGKSIVLERSNGDEAKRAAKVEKRRDVPPDTPESAPEVKVARVTPVN